MRYYEDFEVGVWRTRSERYAVTKDEIVEMGKKWDPQPFHVDEEAAAASEFGGLVASSVHLFAITVSLSPLEGEVPAAVSALGFDNMRMRAPARPGDVLWYRSRVMRKRPSASRAGCGIVELEGELFNQDDEVVLSYENAALIRMREPGAAE